MPVYHFHIYDDVWGSSPDQTGTELPDIDTAEREAMKLAGQMLIDSAVVDPCGKERHLDVTDSVGVALFRLDLTVRPTSSALAMHNPCVRASSGEEDGDVT